MIYRGLELKETHVSVFNFSYQIRMRENALDNQFLPIFLAQAHKQ